MGGCAFFDSGTVLPVLLARLGASDVTVGLARLIQTLGYTLPALLSAHYVHGRSQHKSFLLATCGISRLGLVALPFLIVQLARSNPAGAAIAVIGVTALFWGMDGACAVSWFDILAKAIPARIRGIFFGVMQSAGGVMAIGAGLVVREVLGNPQVPYPMDFAILAGLWAVGAWASWFALAAIREPAPISPTQEPRKALGDYIRQTIPLLRRVPRLRRLIVIRVLLDAGGLAAPFYVLYAQRDLRVTIGMVGAFTMAQSLGKVATGPLWGLLSDRLGTHVSIRAIAAVSAAIPMVSILARPEHAVLMVLVFVLIGAIQEGTWMVVYTALLEAASEEDRPLAVGVASLCQTPSACYAPVGGLLAASLGYRPVFALASGLVVVALLLAVKLPALPTGHTRQIG